MIERPRCDSCAAPLPEAKLRAAAAFLGARRSMTATGKAGRPPKPTLCANCGEACASARAAAAHCRQRD